MVEPDRERSLAKLEVAHPFDAQVSLLKNLGASPALTMVIMGESLFNDGTAAAVFFLFLGVVADGDDLDPGRVTLFVLRLAVLGPVLGVAFGFGALFLLLLAVRRFEQGSKRVRTSQLQGLLSRSFYTRFG